MDKELIKERILSFLKEDEFFTLDSIQKKYTFLWEKIPKGDITDCLIELKNKNKINWDVVNGYTIFFKISAKDFIKNEILSIFEEYTQIDLDFIQENLNYYPEENLKEILNELVKEEKLKIFYCKN